MDKKMAEQIGLLKHRIISPVLMENGRNQSAYFKSIESKQFEVPGVGFKYFKASTMKGWLKAYRKLGFQALTPKTRSDKGMQRKLTIEQKERIKQFRKDNLDLPVTLFYDKCITENVLTEKHVCYSTFARFLKIEKLFKQRTPQARKKYEMDRFGQLWVADFCHGPKVLRGNGKRERKAILFAIIDDMSRMIVGAKFAFNENTLHIEEVFKSAILAYGLPDRLYVDNGPSFCSTYLSKTCAHLQIALIHSKPYDSPSRGKIERFFRTVRERFLAGCKAVDLESLNNDFDRWLHEDYHHKVHSGIKTCPIDRYGISTKEFPLKRVSKEQLNEHFMVSENRTVKNDATVSLAGLIYEVPAHYIGKRIELRYVQNDKSNIYIYEDDKMICEIKVVDSRANARTYRPTPRDNSLSFHDNREEDV